MNISLLSLHPRKDSPLARELFLKAKGEDPAFVHLPESMKKPLLMQQYEAQLHQYEKQFPSARVDIIYLGQQAVGRMMVERKDDQLRLIDIFLLLDKRGQGIGAHLIRQLQQEAREKALPLFLSVERNNPALKLYQRLGFELLEEGPVYGKMKFLA